MLRPLCAGAEPRRDESHRFIPTAANPLPELSPQDKLMERAYLQRLGVPQV